VIFIVIKTYFSTGSKFSGDILYKNELSSQNEYFNGIRFVHLWWTE